MENFKSIIVTYDESVATLTFNRPALLNAMNGEMMDEIVDALKCILGDNSVRVAIISGTGRAFMAGADIKEYATYTENQFKSFQEKGKQLYELIENAPIPFIAAVNGIALGGGFEIALACDLIIAAKSSVLGLPEVHLGLIPGGGGTQRLLQKVGMNRLREILLLGQSYDAMRMYEWGVVNTIVDDEDFSTAVSKTAEKLKRRPWQSLAAIKRLLNPSTLDLSFEERIQKEGEAVWELFSTETARELIASFVNKVNK